MQNIQNQQNFCTFSQNQQPSILSTHRALLTMEWYAIPSTCKNCNSFIFSNPPICPNGQKATGTWPSFNCNGVEFCKAKFGNTKTRNTCNSTPKCCDA
uniref:Uncharacterized protein n=1 Tax=viral metagenome TaxID=1070528 RepID=A0A6C0D126_9ZZZZ